LIHHDQKLSGVRSNEFENITTAGRAARLLSYVSKEFAWTVSDDRVQALATANGIKKHEVPGLVGELQSAGLVDRSSGGIAVLGVTQANLFSMRTQSSSSRSPHR
jgi:DNA-binding IclR family transcriptional regulator